MDLPVRALMIGMIVIPCIFTSACGVTLVRRKRHALGGMLLASGIAWMILPFVPRPSIVLLMAVLFTVGSLWAAWLGVDDEWARVLALLAGVLTTVFGVAILKQVGPRVFGVDFAASGPIGVLLGIGVTISFVVLKRSRARASSERRG